MGITTYFLPAFLSTLMTVATGCSMAIVFDRLGRWIFKNDEVLARSMYFFCGLLMLSWLLLLAGMAGVVRQAWVSHIPYLFIVAGLMIVIGQRSFQPIQLFMQPFRMLVNSRWDKITRAAVYITSGAFFLICLAPPTDADSLDYHLGVPMDILARGNLFFDGGNLHFRLFGFGEMLNMPGVAAGCPQLGAFIQFLSFRYLLRVYSDPVGGKTRLDLMVICLGLPLLMFLVSTQKHQLTGLAATCVAFYALQQKDGLLKGSYVFLFWTTLVLAICIKYAFIISAIAIVILLVIKNFRRAYLSKLLAGLVVFVVFAGPLFAYKAIRFDDPISPLMERFKDVQDPVVVELQLFLQSFRDSTLPLPFNLFLPSSVSNVTTFIGLGSLITILFLFFRGFVAEKIAVLAFILLTLLLGQPTARFFLEPMFWLLPLFFANMPPGKWQKLLFTGFRLQLIAMVPALLLSVYLFAPALFTDKGRNDVMDSFAAGYAVCNWMDATLPEDAVVASNVRSRSLMPRKYLPIEYLTHFVNNGGNFDTLDKMAQDFGVDYYVVPNYAFANFGSSFNKPLVACQSLPMATRNPFNKTFRTMCIYKAKP